MKLLYLLLFVFGFQQAYAHNPDLSSLMIYQQNGKTILLMKSSLTAFEGEVDLINGKNAYTSPEAFNQLVSNHVQKNCLILVNGDTIQLSNIQVQLGHETDLFAELDNMPKQINSFYVKNTTFKDMSNNLCEVILSDLDELPLKQYILNNANQHEVAFVTKDNKWSETALKKSSGINTPLLLAGGGLLLGLVVVGSFRKSTKRNGADGKICL